MASIVDIAKEAQVAPSTVSLVLNNRAGVSNGTRLRVQKVLKELRYMPRQAAQAPRYHVAIIYAKGLVIYGALVDYCRQWIKGIRDSMSNESVDVSVLAASDNAELDLMFKSALAESEFHCLVGMGLKEHHGYIEKAIEKGLPVVAINRLPKRNEFSCVCDDYYGMGQKAARKLFELGHHRLILDIPDDGRLAITYLRDGFISEVAKFGGEVIKIEDFSPITDPLAIDNKEFDVAHVEIILQRRATACFCGSPCGMLLVNAMEKMGVSVPEQFSVLGIDHIGLHSESGKIISTIGHEPRTMGKMAGFVLKKIFEDREEIHNIIITVPNHIQTGQTLGPAPR